MRVYNSFTGKKEEFKPLVEGEVRMYACGVTPYDEIHVGHARQAIVYDVMRTYLEYSGYKVLYVRNFTDVDDKIIDRANRDGKSSSEVSERYIKESLKDLELLKVEEAKYQPKVTECMDDIIDLIQILIDKRYAYVAEGEVFFDISKFPDYGKLSNRKKEDLINTEKSPNKKGENDFVLWKPHKEGEPYWDSPWSKGRPGWHIECSAMIKRYLGDQIDIHGGGIDLVFPHHENEVAQSESATGVKFVNYWLHNGMVMFEGTKMSKSLGNFSTAKDLLKRYFPDEIRYVVLTHGYGSNIDFSEEIFLNARKKVYYFYNTLLKASEFKKDADLKEENVPNVFLDFEKKFRESMDDNFNTPKVISEINEVFKELNKVIDSKQYSADQKKDIVGFFYKTFKDVSSTLRLFDEDPLNYLSDVKKKILEERGIEESIIEKNIRLRSSFKEKKDYESADKVKEELVSKGISIQDTPGSTKWDIIF